MYWEVSVGELHRIFILLSCTDIVGLSWPISAYLMDVTRYGICVVELSSLCYQTQLSKHDNHLLRGRIFSLMMIVFGLEDIYFTSRTPDSKLG